MSRTALRLPPALRSYVERAQRLRARTTADAGLARLLEGGVAEAGLAVRGLAFYVHDGVVSIYGGVADGEAREAVLDVVCEQPGVQRVVDHLRIGSG